ncbi:MAG: dienelactone hydrolase family protein [Acetobacteraceae bacterium]|nr:dienelactone hydrolase family protein [Acetobacteraceae bacterium]
MIEREVAVTTGHGVMPSFAVHPDGPGPWPGIILYMDAPGIREELRNMARRIARAGYVCVLPDMYYRLGLIRFDVPRRNDAMSAVIRAAMNHLTNALVMDDTAALIAWLDAQDKAKPGPVGCVGYCMSGRYVTTAAARFPHRIAAAASLYGVGIVTDEEDSPHLLLDRVRGELYYAFAEHDRSVPDHVIPALRAALAKTEVKHAIDIYPGTQHGFAFPERAVYDTLAAEDSWAKIFAMWDRCLR